MCMFIRERNDRGRGRINGTQERVHVQCGGIGCIGGINWIQRVIRWKSNVKRFAIFFLVQDPFK